MIANHVSPSGRSTVTPVPARSWLSRYWLWVLSLILGMYVGLPFLAPAFMQIGWTGPGNFIYLVYSTQCHQLPQRSFFLFGAKTMYSLTEIQAAWENTNDPMVLRQFIGSDLVGWKVAWSDRMVSMYTSTFIGSLVYGLFRKKIKRPLPVWAFVLLVLPMAMDGGSHLVSDLAGIGNGFRDTNTWLAALTNSAFPASFYAGDSLGSFNSWARLITGVLFGLGVVAFALPYVDEMFSTTPRQGG